MKAMTTPFPVNPMPQAGNTFMCICERGALKLKTLLQTTYRFDCVNATGLAKEGRCRGTLFSQNEVDVVLPPTSPHELVCAL